jgi:hypothetical protein
MKALKSSEKLLIFLNFQRFLKKSCQITIQQSFKLIQKLFKSQEKLSTEFSLQISINLLIFSIPVNFISILHFYDGKRKENNWNFHPFFHCTRHNMDMYITISLQQAKNKQALLSDEKKEKQREMLVNSALLAF